MGFVFSDDLLPGIWAGWGNGVREKRIGIIDIYCRQ